jgi:isoleucyl-tRNA synthetase
VPIPAVDCTSCGEAILTQALVDRAAALFDIHGADAWYERPVEEFLPDGLACPKCGGTNFEREQDILDVWFDSGSSTKRYCHDGTAWLAIDDVSRRQRPAPRLVPELAAGGAWPRADARRSRRC